MAISATVSKKELERVAGLAYEGQTVRVILCNVGLTDYTSESTVADWQSVEVPTANGYSSFSAVVGTGSYNVIKGAYVMPVIPAAFTASGDGFGYDRIVVYIDGATYPHSVIIENPNIILRPGQTQTYNIFLWQDD